MGRGPSAVELAGSPVRYSCHTSIRQVSFHFYYLWHSIDYWDILTNQFLAFYVIWDNVSFLFWIFFFSFLTVFVFINNSNVPMLFFYDFSDECDTFLLSYLIKFRLNPGLWEMYFGFLTTLVGSINGDNIIIFNKIIKVVHLSIHLSIHQPDHPRGLNLIYLSIYQPDHPQSTGTAS